MSKMSFQNEEKEGCVTGTAARRMSALRAKLAEEVRQQIEYERMEDDIEYMDWSPTPVEALGSGDDSQNSYDSAECKQHQQFNPSRSHSMFSDGLDVENSYRVYIIDTNVFIDDLYRVEALMDFCQETTNYSVVVLPYQVIKELDNLKWSKPDLAKSVDACIQLIRMQLSANVKSQHPKDACHEQYGNTGDDSILACALQVQEEFDETSHITIVTHDANLRLKALAAKIGENTIRRVVDSLKHKT